MNSTQKSYTILSFSFVHRATHVDEITAMSFKKQEKGFERVELRVRGTRLTMGVESRSYHLDLPEDLERDLLDGRGPSSSGDVTLEEEGIMVAGGRLPRFLNLSSKFRFLDNKGRRAEVSMITLGKFENK